MKKNILINFVKQLLNFIFPCLIVTDLFIVFFYQALNFMNNNFPKPIMANLLFTVDERPLLKPEYDISIYLVTLFLLMFFFWLVKKISQTNLFNQLKKKKFNTFIKLILIVPLGLYFISKLGPFPLSEGQQINNSYSFPYLLVITWLLLFFGGLFWLVRKNRTFKVVLMIILVIVIAFLTFAAKFPIYYHEYAFFTGPILEIAHGKTIYSQIGSQYSFLLVLLLGYLAKFSLFDIAYMPVLIWLLYIVQYFFCFYLIYKISDSVMMALLGLFSIITVNYYSLMHLGINFPQIGPARWLPLILSIYFLYRFQDIRSKKFILILAFLTFFMVDSGIYIIMAYLTTLATIFIKEKIGFLKILKNILFLFISLIGFYLVINLINLSLGYRFINIALAFSKIGQYSQLGFGMLPILGQSYIWLIIATYIISLIYYFKQIKTNLTDNILIYSAHLSVFTSIYYLGRSHPHNLFNISLFVIFNISILISIIIKKKSVSWLKPVILLIFYLLFIVMPTYARGQAISENIKQQLDRLSLKDIFIPDIKDVLAKYEDEVSLINNYIPEKNIVIIFVEDTYLFYLTNKNNLMNMNPQNMISTQEDSDFGLSNVFKICPKRIAVECNLFNRCDSPQSIDQVQRLKLIETKCEIKYYPLICTYQLCIGEAK